MVVRRFLLLVPAASLLGIAVCCAAGNDPESLANPCVTYLPGQFSEFLIQADGSVILFPSNYRKATQVWDGGKWRTDATLATEGNVRDAILAENGCWRLVSQTSSSKAALYEYSGSALRLLGRLSGTLERATLHQAADGSTWLCSARGRAYGLKDGENLGVKECGAAYRSRKGRDYVPAYLPTVSLNVPDHGLWFWSHEQRKGPTEPAIDGFMVYQDGEWRPVARNARKLGGAVLWNPDTIIAYSRSNGLFRVDVNSGEVREMDCRLPPDEHCLFLHATPEGNLLLITVPPSMFGGQLLAWKDGQLKTLIEGVDSKCMVTDKGRAVVDVPEGVFMAEAQSGLLFVSSDLGTVRRLDWRHGMPLLNIDRMRRSGRRLCVLDRDCGFAIIDYPTLLQASPVPSSSRWSVVAAASPPILAPDGSVWYLAAKEPPLLSHWSGTNVTHVAVEGNGFRTGRLEDLTTDTKNRLWLTCRYERERTAFLDAGAWRAFDNRAAAYSTVALEEAGNPDYRIGNPDDRFYPAFAGDGRVAFQDERRYVCVFDGKQWDTRGMIDGQSPIGPPFYREGVLTARTQGGCYEYLNGAWQATNADIKSPYATHPAVKIQKSNIPNSFPGDASKSTVRLRDNQGTMWIGDTNALWRGLDDVWVPFPVLNSPLDQAPGMTSVQADGSGAIWFALGGGNFTRLVRYQPDGSSPTVAWATTPAEDSDTDTFECAVQIAGSGTNYMARQQIDDGAWQHVSVAQQLHVVRSEHISNGIHTIRVQVFDNLLRASNLLEHHFSVARDYEREVGKWVPLLSSSDFSQRELAAKALVGIGPPALPVLRKLENDAESDQQWWIRAVKEEIERRSAGTTADSCNQ